MGRTELPDAIFPAGACGRAQIGDFDQLASLSPGWEEEALQIGRGKPSVDVSFASTGRLQLACFQREPGVRVRGTAGPGVAIMGVALSGSRLNVQGEELPVGRLAVIPAGVEFEFLCAESHRLLLLLVDARVLHALGLEGWGRPIARDRPLTFLHERREGASRVVAASWLRAIDRAVRDPAMARDGRTGRDLERDVLEPVLREMVPADPAPGVRPRRELAIRAERYLRDTLEGRPNLSRICHDLGTSTRALHASFQLVFGVPPKAYQRMLRLQAARKDLLRARPGTTVSQVAVKWGFQCGYFAVDYRRMFGERPSETLGRVLAGKAA